MLVCTLEANGISRLIDLYDMVRLIHERGEYTCMRERERESEREREREREERGERVCE
jgi:hypothetical protein